MTITIKNLDKTAPLTISLQAAHEGIPSTVRAHPSKADLPDGSVGVVVLEREIYGSLMLAPGEQRTGLPASIATDPAIVRAKKRQQIAVTG